MPADGLRRISCSDNIMVFTNPGFSVGQLRFVDT